MIRPSQIIYFRAPLRAIAPSQNRPDEYFIGDENGVVHRYNPDEDENFLEGEYKIDDNCLDVTRNLVAVHHDMGLFQIKNYQTQELLWSKGLNSPKCMRISPDETVFVASFTTNTCYIFDMDTKQITFQYIGHQFLVNCLVFSASGNEIFSADTMGHVLKWNFRTGETVAGSRMLDNHITSIAASRDLVVVTVDSAVIVFNANSLDRIHTLPTDGHMCYGIVFSPNGEYFAAISHTTNVLLWHANSGRRIITTDTHNDHVYAICFSSNSNTLAVADADRSLSLYNNLPLCIFLVEQGLTSEHVKTVQSFFYIFIDYINELFPFNNNDYDNYFLMRILIQLRK